MAKPRGKPVRMRPIGAHPPDDDRRRRLSLDLLLRIVAVGLYDAGKYVVQALTG